MLYDDMGDYTKAEPLFQRSLAMREKAFGAEHPTVAQSMNNLAFSYNRQGAYAKAETFYKRALMIWEQMPGQEHPHLAKGLANLASLYDDIGEHAKAELLLKRALPITAGHEALELIAKINRALSNHYAKAGAPEVAIYYGKRALSVTHTIQAGMVSMDIELQKAFMNKYSNDYQKLIKLLETQGHHTEAQQIGALLTDEGRSALDNRDSEKTDHVSVSSIPYTGPEKSLVEHYDALCKLLVALTSEKEELDNKPKASFTPEGTSRLEALSSEIQSTRIRINEFIPKVYEELGKTDKDVTN